MPTKIPLEQEYAFVLSCLQSALDNAGKINFDAVAKQHNTAPSGAQQRIRRCQKSANLGGGGLKGDAKTGKATDAANPAKPDAKRGCPTSGNKNQGGKKKRKLDDIIDDAQDHTADDWDDDKLAVKTEQTVEEEE